MEKEELFHRISGLMQLVEVMQSAASQGLEIGEDLLEILYRDLSQIRSSLESE